MQMSYNSVTTLELSKSKQIKILSHLKMLRKCTIYRFSEYILCGSNVWLHPVGIYSIDFKITDRMCVYVD